MGKYLKTILAIAVLVVDCGGEQVRTVSVVADPDGFACVSTESPVVASCGRLTSQYPLTQSPIERFGDTVCAIADPGVICELIIIPH
jgi:hypothetical protein